MEALVSSFLLRKRQILIQSVGRSGVGLLRSVAFFHSFLSLPRAAKYPQDRAVRNQRLFVCGSFIIHSGSCCPW